LKYFLDLVNEFAIKKNPFQNRNGFLVYLGGPTVLSMIYELRLEALRPFLLESLPFQIAFIFITYLIGI